MTNELTFTPMKTEGKFLGENNRYQIVFIKNERTTEIQYINDKKTGRTHFNQRYFTKHYHSLEACKI